MAFCGTNRMFQMWLTIEKKSDAQLDVKSKLNIHCKLKNYTDIYNSHHTDSICS